MKHNNEDEELWGKQSIHYHGRFKKSTFYLKKDRNTYTGNNSSICRYIEVDIILEPLKAATARYLLVSSPSNPKLLVYHRVLEQARGLVALHTWAIWGRLRYDRLVLISAPKEKLGLDSSRASCWEEKDPSDFNVLYANTLVILTYSYSRYFIYMYMYVYTIYYMHLDFEVLILSMHPIVVVYKWIL